MTKPPVSPYDYPVRLTVDVSAAARTRINERCAALGISRQAWLARVIGQALADPGPHT